MAGIDVVREEMEELISYLRDYQKYTRAGAVIPSGVLLCGPPGTVQTSAVREAFMKKKRGVQGKKATKAAAIKTCGGVGVGVCCE